MTLLEEVVQRIEVAQKSTGGNGGKLPPGIAMLDDEFKGRKPVWFPNHGPQMDAALSKADWLLYGGQGGGGKTDLILGLSFTQHRNTLILRREYANLTGLIRRAKQINGGNNGFNGSPPPKLQTDDGRLIQFAGCQHLGDELNWMGIPFDLKCFDEASAFLEPQVRAHLGWIRSADPKQRNRAILASNPPLTAEGDWIIGMFRPWLDLTYPKPAKHGELRWYVRTPDDTDMEVSGPEPVQFPGESRPTLPKSRTFIPAALKDNPILARTDYQTTLDALPEPLRSAVRDGNFMAGRKDDRGQVIPLAWIVAAQNRWRHDGYKDAAMTAMAIDPAGGGRDEQVTCWRHGGWYAEFVTEQGEHTAKPTAASETLFMNRRDGAPIVVDTGGGYAGAIITRLDDNRVDYIRFNGGSKTGGRSKDSKLSFANKRAEVWWRFKEELDPEQFGGSKISLPPDPELRADLAAPRVDLRHLETYYEIKIEAKEDIRKRLGRSPGKGDAAVMCLSPGETAVRRANARSKSGSLPKYAQTKYGAKRRGKRSS